MPQQLPTNQGVPVTLQEQLRAAVRHLNDCGIFHADEIATDSQVSRILADLAAASLPEARAA